VGHINDNDGTDNGGTNNDFDTLGSLCFRGFWFLVSDLYDLSVLPCFLEFLVPLIFPTSKTLTYA
jgi:hypothetical protein